MILVTGATGLVGSHLLAELVKTNTPIRALYRTEEKRHHVASIFNYYFKTPERYFNTIEWVKADINDIPSLTPLFKDVKMVYHCAAYISFDPNDYTKLRKINIEGTANIVNLCIENKVNKLCHVSSIATLGQPKGDNAITETTFWNSEADNNFYGITKFGAEMEVWRGTQEGLDAIVVNPGVIIGSGFWRSGSGSIFKAVHKGMSYYTTGSVGIIDVSDVVKLMLALMNSTIKNESYILVAENISYKNLIYTIAETIGKPPPRKKANAFILSIGWRLDWLRSKLYGKRRRLSRQTAKSLRTTFKYSNNKIKKTLNYNFTPAETSITRAATQFLEEQSMNH